jgi:hypothetical protein
MGDNIKMDLKGNRMRGGLYSSDTGYCWLSGFCDQGNEPSSFVRAKRPFSFENDNAVWI